MSKMFDYNSLINECRHREEEEKTQGIDIGAIMLGRLASRLERDFFPKFQELGWQASRRLSSIRTLDDFDNFHHEFIESFRTEIKTRSGTIVSYGEAQQPVNVFLKDYVENIQSLGAEATERLRKFLHVTLDGMVIYYLQSFFREDYLRYIGPHRDACGHFDSGRGLSFHQQDTSQSQLIQLLFIGRDTYYAWQSWFRSISPECPSLLDSIWSIARQTLFSRGPYWTMPPLEEDRSWKGKILKFLGAGEDELA